jgi:hypothetical protein
MRGSNSNPISGGPARKRKTVLTLAGFLIEGLEPLMDIRLLKLSTPQ